MKFYAEPHLLVRVRNNGPLKNVRPFRFDENGEFETDNKYLIKTLIGKFKSDNKEPLIDKEVVTKEKANETIEYSEEELRAMAKEQKIKSWHVKSVETLKEELGV